MSSQSRRCRNFDVVSLRASVSLNFEVLYQAVNGRWRLFGLSVQRANSITPSQITSEKDKSGDPLR
jgi:hypothetical protein